MEILVGYLSFWKVLRDWMESSDFLFLFWFGGLGIGRG
jgi:hypothetical protein